MTPGGYELGFSPGPNQLSSPAFASPNPYSTPAYKGVQSPIYQAIASPIYNPVETPLGGGSGAMGQVQSPSYSPTGGAGNARSPAYISAAYSPGYPQASNIASSPVYSASLNAGGAVGQSPSYSPTSGGPAQSYSPTQYSKFFLFTLY
jgi:DNA-directed RNA polymerase II subunit RPB1